MQLAREPKVHCIGLSVQSSSHLPFAPEVLTLMRDEGITDVPVFVAGAYTPRRFDLSSIMCEIIELMDGRN